MDKRWLKDSALKKHRCAGMTNCLKRDEEKRLLRLQSVKSTIPSARRHSSGYIAKKLAKREKSLVKDRRKREQENTAALSESKWVDPAIPSTIYSQSGLKVHEQSTL